VDELTRDDRDAVHFGLASGRRLTPVAVIMHGRFRRLALASILGLSAGRVRVTPPAVSPSTNRTELLTEICDPLVVDGLEPSTSFRVPGVGAVLVQAMVSAALPLIAWNVRGRLGASFPFAVFYSQYSEPSVHAMLGHDPHARLVPLPGQYYTAMGGKMPARDGLQALFTDAVFWDAVAAALPPGTTHVLTVHDDAWICAPNAAERLRRYLPWADYVGAPWGWTNDRDSDRFLISDFFIDKHAGPAMVQQHVKGWQGDLTIQGTMSRAKVCTVNSSHR
jgi:hypothetical protein